MLRVEEAEKNEHQNEYLKRVRILQCAGFCLVASVFDLHLKLTQDLRVKLTHPGDLALMPVTGFTSGNLR
jgi:hypothetical protein